MSTVNVRCINCNQLFEVDKEAAQQNFAGFCDEGDVVTKEGAPGAVELHFQWAVYPPPATTKPHCLCPRCACAVMRVALNNTEKDLPDLMNGTHLSTENEDVENL